MTFWETVRYLLTFKWLRAVQQEVQKASRSVHRLSIDQEMIVAGTPYKITGVWQYRELEDGEYFTYKEYALQELGVGKDQVAAMEVVRDDGETTVTLFTHRLDPDSLGFDASNPENWPKSFTNDGRVFKLDERGTLETRLQSAEERWWRAQYADYSDGDLGRISIEVYTGETEVWHGIDIDEVSIEHLN